jgi:hypothetical protein
MQKKPTAEERSNRAAYAKEWRKRNPDYHKLRPKLTAEEKVERAAYMKKWRKQKLVEDPGYFDRNKESWNRAKEKYRASPKGKATEAAYLKNYLKRPKTKKLRLEATFRKHHGVTRAEANAMIEKQGGLCLICQQPAKGKGHCSRLHVDHCQESGKIRGMLCVLCNRGLGCFGEDIQRIRAATNYLKKHAN